MQVYMHTCMHYIKHVLPTMYNEMIQHNMIWHAATRWPPLGAMQHLPALAQLEHEVHVLLAYTMYIHIHVCVCVCVHIYIYIYI